ncbi:MAG: malto-oligosyltrehalose trehalohydrolase [Desulfobacterales bacterium]
MMRSPRLGATPLSDRRCRFEVWAPLVENVEVRLTAPEDRRSAMNKHGAGYFTAVLDDIPPDTRYVYRLQYADSSARERPDPASRYQPDGVHEPSGVVSADFDWNDAAWCGLPLSRYVVYELHVGTFTPEGTFDGVTRHLDELSDLGVTAVELMPVAQFPGNRNWGYDGVYPFAVQNSYGGPEGLKRLVNACHRKGLAVVLDVVYNHLGPEGNYLRDFGPYFTDFYQTPWGEALNFDGPHSDEVRRYFIENALQWIGEFHIDALRLDAVHAILDFSARPFLEELGRVVHRSAEELQRPIHLIAESALNDTRIVRPRELGGFNLDAQWNDDFHHSLHTALTRERSGYYRDYDGLKDLARAWQEGYVYAGQYSAYRQRAHGNSSRNVPARQLLVFAQNHDQVGNRMLGDRLAGMVSLEKQKLAAGLVLLSPFIPLIFMGEEYGETAPFQYFVSHTDPELVEAVRKGRRREFAAFDWQADSPDPQDEQTFLRSKLNRSLQREGHHRTMYEFHREVLGLRTRIPALANLSKKNMSVSCDPQQNLLLVRRRFDDDEAGLLFNFNGETGGIRIHLPAGRWCKRIDSAEPRWMGPGSSVPITLLTNGTAELKMAPYSVAVFSRYCAPD